jgi:(E)-4-hydroxy-3-methylbut-2-enyl-diphosphate synthase
MHTPEAAARQSAVPPFTDRRVITSFARRSGRLPAQKEGDELDYRGLLNRDGSALLSVRFKRTWLIEYLSPLLETSAGS